MNVKKAQVRVSAHSRLPAVQAWLKFLLWLVRRLGILEIHCEIQRGPGYDELRCAPATSTTDPTLTTNPTQQPWVSTSTFTTRGAATARPRRATTPTGTSCTSSTPSYVQPSDWEQTWDTVGAGTDWDICDHSWLAAPTPSSTRPSSAVCA